MGDGPDVEAEPVACGEAACVGVAEMGVHGFGVGRRGDGSLRLPPRRCMKGRGRGWIRMQRYNGGMGGAPYRGKMDQRTRV